MGTKKKSIADELLELYNPAPAGEYDPDTLDLGDGAKLASDDEYEHERQRPSKRAPEKAMLLRGDIVMEDAAYRGRKTSRAAVFGDDGDADLDLGPSDSEDEGEDSGDDLGEDEELADGDEGEEEEEGEEEGAHRERRAQGARAGTSGRAGAAMAPSGKAPRAAGKAPSAALAKGGGPAAVDSEDEGTTEDDEGFEDDGTVNDEDDGASLGTESDPDLAEAGPGSRDRKGSAGAAAGARGQKRSGGVGGSELDDLEAEYEALQEEDEQQLAALRQKSERDRVKGVAVRNQQVLYERALEQRILLQRCLQASNGLPRPDTHALLAATQPDVRQGFVQLAAAARSTLDQLLQLQRTLMGRVPGITLLPDASAGANGQPPSASAPAPHQAGSKRGREEGDGAAEDEEDGEEQDRGSGGPGQSADELWQRLCSHHEALSPYRDASLDLWHRRTVLSSGSGALRNNGLRALNQSVSSQVHALLRDPVKFIKRTRLTLSACPRVLCEPRSAGGPATGLGADADGAAAAPHAAAPSSSSVAVDVVEEERDAETYDDSEFYQQLLKEFLDKGLAQGATAGAPKAAKKRKLVDRKASKGRKLRFDVQEKLVAFMAPVDLEPPPFAANLFSNLFGHAGK